ncbi:MAG: copper chaperone [Bacteroidota bacterium]
MKKIIFLLSFFSFFTLMAFAQMPKPQRAEIKIPTAVCEECKNIIETGLPKMVDGLIKVNVIFKRGVALVQWYPDRTNIEELKTAIANLGFDADDITANIDYYKKLPICCKKVEDGGGVPKKKKPGTK